MPGRYQARLARPQRVRPARMASVPLGITWYEAKIGIVRDAVRAYLSDPMYNLPQMATA